MIRTAFAGVILCVVCCGCGSEKESAEVVYPVSGVVKYNGQPAAGADITFYNADKKRSAFGRTNEKGEYFLTTFVFKDGAVEGRSTVTIVKFEPPTATVPEADIESENYQPPAIGKDATPPTRKSEFPEKYGDQALSGLMGIVTTDGPNKFDFEL